MQLRHLQTVAEASSTLSSRVTAICFSPNGRRLAVATVDRVVSLYDENGDKLDKFSTKPADPEGARNYIVRAMQFSPDSTRLAIAQSDNIVFVYKLGLEWKDRKSICNKFGQSSPITCLTWPSSRPMEVVYGLAEGKVKVGTLRNNRPFTLYPTDSYVTAVASSLEGNSVVSGHMDGSVYVFNMDDAGAGARVIANHPSVPYALTWGHSIAVAGNDRQVFLYKDDGAVERVFDYTSDDMCREFTCAITNPTGESIVLGNFDRFYIYSHNSHSDTWEESGIKQVQNMYTVTAMDWKSDGSRLALGTLTGLVDVYDVCLQRTRYKGKFEFTFSSHSQVIVKKLADSAVRIVLKSQYGCEITKVNIFQDRYVVANSTQTLILADMSTRQISEVRWHGDGTEKYIFDHPCVAIVYYAGEVSLVEYGTNEILGSVRTDSINRHLLSVRINERPPRSSPDDPGTPRHDEPDGQNKKIAYLLDAQTVCVRDLASPAFTTVNHDSRVDFLELNGRGNLLLFRDRRKHLHLYDLDTQKRTTLLNYCTYVQWVPESDVVVAQNRNNLCVWYNIHAPDQCTMHQIEGEVEYIERGDNMTVVVIDMGIDQESYELDEPLIQFGTAIDDRNYPRAMGILEALDLTPEAEAMWQQLSDMALAHGDLAIAERCAAALGNVSRARFLHKTNKIAEADRARGGGMMHYNVQANLALLRKDLEAAEDVLLRQGKQSEAIDMYRGIHRMHEALSVADRSNHPDAAHMRQEYFQHLLDTAQEEEAGALQEEQGDFTTAINLFLKGGFPAKAAGVIEKNNITQPQQLLETVASALTRAGMHDRAGNFYERLDDHRRALDCYLKGNAYHKAVELARNSFPGMVVELQEAWGDYRVSQKQVDMAIRHYIDAKCYTKAIDAALQARQITKALELVEGIDRETGKPYYLRLARHYEESHQLELAERCYVAADDPEAAVKMYTRANRWEMAHKLASSYMSEGEVGLLYINQAQKMEQEGRFSEAEKLYLTVDEVDLAINMYKKNRRFDDMVRLVEAHRAELLKETHQFLAQTLEMEGNLRDAEYHYAESGEWLSAVNMYRSNEMWDDAIRVAKFHGGMNACKRVTVALVMAVGASEGAKLLTKQGLLEPAIDHLMENGAFDLAFEVSRLSAPRKLPDVYLKHALFLEDDERYQEAEAEFINARKPREAIDMYVHQSDWDSALRVAEQYDPASVPDVLVEQAKAFSGVADYAKAEALFVRAAKPESALDMYKSVGMWPEALRLVQTHLPHKVAEVSKKYEEHRARTGKGGNKESYLSAGRECEQEGNWAQAIETYMSATTDNLGDPDALEDIWLRAVEVARSKLVTRTESVVQDVCQRLQAVGKHRTAGEVLFEVGRIEDAVEVCIQGECFDKAQELAQGNRKLVDHVEDELRAHLKRSEDPDNLVTRGHTTDALDVIARRGDWRQVWEVAAKERVPAETVAKYSVMRIEAALESKEPGNDLDDAVRTMQRHGAVPSSRHLDTYKRLVRAVMARDKNEEEAAEDHAATVSDLRESLYSLANQFRSHEGRVPEEFEQLLMAVHFANMRLVCLDRGLLEFAAKISVTLLRYSQYIPADKLFYQAGMACRDLGDENLAFMLLNRYVDIFEAIAEQDADMIDHTDFREATLVRWDFPLPSKQYLPDTQNREEVREWVLAACTDARIEQELPSASDARGTIYEGLFPFDEPTCIVTGYPVDANDKIEANGAVANRRHWNEFVQKTRTCPWTWQPQNPVY